MNKPQKTTRKTIWQPEDWWKAFSREAKRRRMTVSEWVGETCKKHIKDPTKLSERPPAHRPKS